MSDIFEQLFEVLKERKTKNKQNSYVSSLYKKGLTKITEKIAEESQEVIEAALKEKDSSHITYEICDLLFHTFVLAQYYDIDLETIKSELSRRFGTSGITEKNNRKK